MSTGGTLTGTTPGLLDRCASDTNIKCVVTGKGDFGATAWTLPVDAHSTRKTRSRSC